MIRKFSTLIKESSSSGEDLISDVMEILKDVEDSSEGLISCEMGVYISGEFYPGCNIWDLEEMQWFENTDESYQECICVEADLKIGDHRMVTGVSPSNRTYKSRLSTFGHISPQSIKSLTALNEALYRISEMDHEICVYRILHNNDSFAITQHKESFLIVLPEVIEHTDEDIDEHHNHGSED